MIISKKYAKQLLAAKKAQIETGLLDNDGEYNVAITRFDIQRTDHFVCDRAEHARLCDKYPPSWSHD